MSAAVIAVDVKTLLKIQQYHFYCLAGNEEETLNEMCNQLIAEKPTFVRKELFGLVKLTRNMNPLIDSRFVKIWSSRLEKMTERLQFKSIKLVAVVLQTGDSREVAGVGTVHDQLCYQIEW